MYRKEYCKWYSYEQVDFVKIYERQHDHGVSLNARVALNFLRAVVPYVGGNILTVAEKSAEHLLNRLIMTPAGAVYHRVL
jgi:hypothetical protein